jgi:hypothetical protein
MRIEEPDAGRSGIVQRLKGMAAAFGALLTIAHVAVDFFMGRH